ncbi:hypothetical protein [Alphaproteobacteria bacterium endosymbiont of Tiliacea citrago]|uniref:hypothetical protein n=1 Tax=Alphaproteobacteria bacterium endosymbiont of Tiliacea citrago TaxID=3077944 RepID=UPI00313C7BC9
MKKKFFLLIYFFLETQVIRQIPIKNTSNPASEASIKKLIFNQNPSMEEIDSGSLFLNIRVDGLFFSSKSQEISPKIKKKLKKNICDFYKKNATSLNQLLELHNKKTHKKKFKTITFHKKNSHKNLIYNFNLAFKLFSLAKNKKTKRKWKKTYNLLKKQLFLFYLHKELVQNRLFAYHSLKTISSKKNFGLWLKKTIDSSHFERILKQTQRKL